MKMYYEVKKIEQCSSCGDYLRTRRLVVYYKNEYVCPDCYMMMNHSEDEKKKEEAENAKRKMYEEIMRHIEGEEESEESIPEQETVETQEKKMMPPKEIVEHLNKNIIGQDEAKKVLAVAVYNHYRRVFATENKIRIPKSNILMQGSTGSGKTYLLKNLAKILDVPFYIADASLITEAGYKGNDVECVLTGLYQAADCDIVKAEKGIVYLDEFDKLSVHFGHSGDKNTSVGAGVQRQILKMLEGCEMEIPKTGTKKNGETVRINTENILFICGGAFVGIGEHKEIKTTRSIGFGPMEDTDNSCKETEKKKLTTEDFIEYGLIPEIVGRLPIIVALNHLEESDICAILTDSGESILRSYKALLKEYGVKLVFKQDAIEEIAHQAYIRGTGARGINAIVEGVMQDLMYEIPSDETISKCVITKGVISHMESPLIEHKTLMEEENQLKAS